MTLRKPETIVVYDNGHARVVVQTELDPSLRKNCLYLIEVEARFENGSQASVIWGKEIKDGLVIRGFFFEEEITAEERLLEAVATARSKADEHASKYPDSLKRSREALLGIKRELAAMQEISLLLEESEGKTQA